MSLLMLIFASAVLGWLFWKDYREMILPNWANALLAILGIVYHVVLKGQQYLSWIEMLLGAVLGSGVLLFSWYIFKKIKKIDGLGMGDVKFCLAAGIWLGINYIGQMLFFSSLLLLLGGAIYAVCTKKSMQHLKMPFGVTLAPVTAVMIWLLFGANDLSFLF